MYVVYQLGLLFYREKKKHMFGFAFPCYVTSKHNFPFFLNLGLYTIKEMEHKGSFN